MILKGNQRSSARQLAVHLLNERDNEHVEVHEIRGFASDDQPVEPKRVAPRLQARVM